jgi:hypothetical protein
MVAELAVTTGCRIPIDYDAVADLSVLDVVADFCDLSGDVDAGDDRRVPLVATADPDICMIDRAGFDLYQNLFNSRIRLWDLFDGNDIRSPGLRYN